MRRRSGFTIVELLVAMALIMFIMAILSEAFVAGLKSFRDLKATADLAERLRSASTILRRDLSEDHFDGKRRLGRLDFWQSEGPGLIGPPREGFFRVYQGSAPSSNPIPPAVTSYLYEGSDSLESGLPIPVDSRLLNSYRVTDHMLHFTVKLRGNERGDYFSTGNLRVRRGGVPSPLVNSPQFYGSLHYQDTNTVFNSQWAEVVYFLRALPPDNDANGTPLYALYRRQLLLVPDNGLMSAPVLQGAQVPRVPPLLINVTPNRVTPAQYEYPEISCSYSTTTPTTVYFNNPRDVTMPARRFGMAPYNAADAPQNLFQAGRLSAVDPLTGRPSYPTMYEDTNNNVNYQGADLLLTDVVSFEVRVLPAIVQTNGPRFVSLFDADMPGFNNNNTVYPAAATNTGPRVYDTWSNMVEIPATATPPPNDYSTFAVPNGGQPQSIPFTPGLRLRAVQIILRVWDSKTEQTREVTITQDL